MCGIVGWVDWGADLTHQSKVLKGMMDTLVNRGPDDSGIWLSHCAALGHRRLIVVDPAGGGQPMTRKVGGNAFTIVYNGELYNTQELRKELEDRGHTFLSYSDTEALLLSYIEWGADCLGRLNGIFAFGIWNDSDQSLFLARDRLGVKPLFYTQKGGSLMFASEIKALLAHPMIQARIDREGLAEIFALGPARTPGKGVFYNINEIKPGHYMLYNREGICMKRYWSLKSCRHYDDPETTAVKIHDLLQDAVELQLVADVPVCTLLSGGLDSSALSAFAAAAYRKRGMGPLNTFSVDYAGNDRYFKSSEFQPNSDGPWIELVSQHLGTRHHPVTIDTPQLVEALAAALRARDLPGMADIDSSLYLFCKEIKKKATVAISGECADEIFGGYPWFHRDESLKSNTFPWSQSIKNRCILLSRDLQSKIDLEGYVAQRYRDTLSEVPRLSGESPAEARRRELFYLNITWFMATLLDRKDRMSMAAGLEVRVPFCDHRLVEYVWNIPWEIKTWGQREKGILRKALKDVLPRDVLLRKKSPYPKTHNPSYTQAVVGGLGRIIEDPASPLPQLVNVDVVKELLRSADSGMPRPWFGQLMTLPQLFAYLIQIDIWLREYNVDIIL